MKYFIGTLTWTHYLEQPEGYKTDLKFIAPGVHVFTCQVTQDSCKRIREVQIRFSGSTSVGWVEGDTELAENYTLSVEEEMKIVNARQEICTKRIISVDNKVDFSVDIICIVLTGSWCDIIVLNAHVRTEEQCCLIIACFFIRAWQSTLLLRAFK